MSKVECLLCPKRCELVEGQRGDCKVRLNLEGKLKTLVYGKVCAAHVDPIEKKPLSHVLPSSRAFSIATAGCNLHCKFCQNWQISQREPEETENHDLTPEDVVNLARQYKCETIAYTYSEPVVFYEYMVDTARLAHQFGIRNVWVTAAFIEGKPLDELCNLIDAANIDLKSIRDRYYADVCYGRLKPVQDAIVKAANRGVWVELTNLIVPTLNDSDEDLTDLCRWIVNNVGVDVPLHFSRFHPMYQLENLPATPVETLIKAREIAIAEGINYVYIGNVPGRGASNTYCPNCRALLIERKGYYVALNRVGEDGRCDLCGHKIPGIWK
ncbi:AmmeMemoRadiSam system radical SAM enzyme [candidate division TA06 bacterium]|uniref:AmmeMemoRadiSam system radical SAM enzyme n=1 Tax=candidate division TA06 bacterium TaxID=2250710 RepID=A0A523UPW2_UNCT6|nr:MAG: AmmeMemoRadiSam system radical SAM enzyme [candidate division TA06 bacterium]